jgi:lysophospholipid acyltransferase (LPLAT)-like uncharacterized protein
MREKILGFIAFLIVRLIGMTLRYKLHFKSPEDKDLFYKYFNEKKPTIDTKYLLAFFHQDELCLLNFFKNRNMSVLISISKDGEIMSNAAGWLGYKPVRGSSSKKAVSGLIAGIKKVRSGYKMAFAVDGPRGPIYKVKDGICAVAKKTESQRIPVRAIASNQKIFEKSWNKAKFPKPFSRIDMHFAPAKIYEKEELESALVNLPQ